MKLNVYSVKDVKVAFLQPFFMQNNALAHRAFVSTINTPGNPIAQYPQDHELWHIGTFDDETGLLTPCKPQLLFLGSDLKEVKPHA